MELISGRDSGAGSSCSTCVITTSGEVYCWGYNEYGQLGNNSTTDSSIPIQVLGVGGSGTLSNIVQISVGVYYACALTASKTVYCWGSNGSGQLGNNSTSTSKTPVQVKNEAGTGYLTGVSQISAGGGLHIDAGFSCAVTTSGNVTS